MVFKEIEIVLSYQTKVCSNTAHLQLFGERQCNATRNLFLNYRGIPVLRSTQNNMYPSDSSLQLEWKFTIFYNTLTSTLDRGKICPSFFSLHLWARIFLFFFALLSFPFFSSFYLSFPSFLNSYNSKGFLEENV